MTEVNQVAVVRQDLPRAEVIFFAGGFEFGNRVIGERRGAPLTLIFGEQGEGGRFDFGGADGGIGQLAGGATCAPMYFIKTPVKPLGRVMIAA